MPTPNRGRPKTRKGEVRAGRKTESGQDLASLRRQSRTLEGFFGHSPTPLVILDRDFNFVRVNDAYAHACQKDVEDFAGLNHFALYPHQENEAIFRDVVRTGRPFRTDAKPFDFPDHPEWGTTYWNWTLTPLIDQRGQVELLLFALEDVTRLHQAQRQLAALNCQLHCRAGHLQAMALEVHQSEQRERRRLAVLLHDNLQQALVGAKLSLTAARNRAHDRPVKDALSQVDALLAHSIEASRVLAMDLSPLIVYEADLAAALGWLARQMQTMHGVDVQVRADGVLAEPIEPLRVFLFTAARELLLNVARHSQAQQADVSLRSTGDVIMVTVTDRGVGFDVAATRAAGGSTGGFGLFSIAQRIELLGGSLTIDSSPGRGSTVVLTAPLAKNPAAKVVVSPTSAAPQTSTLAQRQGKRITVLLVDDHKVMREGLAALLGEEPDIEIVGEAADGKTAIELAQSARPDAIIMDISMPGMNGIEATAEIIAHQPEICIIGLSMHDESDMAAKMRHAGAKAYVSKGGPAEDLLAAIRANVVKTSGSAILED
ncbi:MAG: response regulator [Planctomycetaceae bacterium]|nr:response regulator [Planctomycetaceae bacterium]